MMAVRRGGRGTSAPPGGQRDEPFFCSSEEDESFFGGKVDTGDISPGGYEQQCASDLTMRGWKTRWCGGSGDQGADVIATKAGKRLVLQCKLYNRPVGNRAVQEVHAARLYHRADFAAVVTNSTYTSAAEALARSAWVKLLHTSDLCNIDRLLGIVAPPSRTIRVCDHCFIGVRLPTGKSGTVRCPACGRRFWTTTE